QKVLRLRGEARHASPFRRLAEERTRFVIEFSPDRIVDFEDADGRLVRLRYQPSYRAAHASGYGLLGPEHERTPDLALEVFSAPDPNRVVPDLIVVLDAKYTSASQAEKLETVRQKYSKIGIFRTGLILSRPVWALTPGP